MTNNIPLKYPTEVYDIILRDFQKGNREISLVIKSELDLDVPEEWINNFRAKMRKKFRLLAETDEVFVDQLKKNEIDTQEGLYQLYTLLKKKIEDVDTTDRKDIELLMKISNQIIMLLNTEMKRKGEYQIGINKKEVSVVQIHETLRHEIVNMVDRVEERDGREEAIVTNPILIDLFKKKKKVAV